MKQRFLSTILCITLLASVIVGAISVSIKTSSADTPGDYADVYFVNVISYLEETGAFSEASLSGFAEYVGSKLSDTEENENYLVCMIEDHGSIAISLFQLDPMNGSWCTVNPYLDYCGIGGSSGARNNYCFASLRYVPGQSQYNFCVYSQNLFTQNQYISNTAYSFTDQDSFTKYRVTGNIFDQRIEGRKCYWSKNVPAGSFSQYVTPYSCPKNLLYNNPLVHFNLVSFSIGIQQFVTINNQNVVRGYKDFPYGNTDGASSHVLIQYLSKDTNEFIEDHLRWSDLYTIDNISFYTDQLVNLEANDIGYAWKVSPDWFGLSVFGIVYKLTGDDPRITGVADNLPFYFEDNDYNTAADNQLTEAWNNFNTYVENYNVTNVIPQDLAEVLFGLNGSLMYPCSVSVPATVWDNSPEADGGTSAAPIHTWKWWYPSGNDVNIGFNYDLFDTVILTYSSSGEYTLINYYDDTLTTPFMPVSNLTFDQIVNQFDIIIIVPDDDGCLSNTWWKQVINTILNNLGADLHFDILNTQAVAGSGSMGIEHITSRPGANAHILQGFSILTYKAIQKQQLWNFNDGITKLYQLEVDYIHSEDTWKTSFLLWSSSIFEMLNTLDGRLNSILNSLNSISGLLNSISGKLDQIAENTSEEDPGYWFISFYNWVKRWEPSNSDFVNWVDSWDDYTDSLPDPGSGVTVIPLPTSIPTAAIAGG